MKYANAKVARLTGEKALPCPGNQGALYPEHHRRYYHVGGRGHEGGKAIMPPLRNISMRFLLYALMQKQESEWHLKITSGKDCHAGESAALFPSKTSEFYHHDLSGIDPRLGEYTFEEIVTQVQNYMRYYLNEKLLRGDITTNAETQRNPFIRVVPLFIKDLVVRQFYTKIQDKTSSAG